MGFHFVCDNKDIKPFNIRLKPTLQPVVSIILVFTVNLISLLSFYHFIYLMIVYFQTYTEVAEKMCNKSTFMD